MTESPLFGMIVFIMFGGIWYYMFSSSGMVGTFVTILGLLGIAAIVFGGWGTEEQEE
jgi:hypothetical protein